MWTRFVSGGTVGLPSTATISVPFRTTVGEHGSSRITRCEKPPHFHDFGRKRLQDSPAYRVRRACCRRAVIVLTRSATSGERVRPRASTAPWRGQKGREAPAASSKSLEEPRHFIRLGHPDGRTVGRAWRAWEARPGTEIQRLSARIAGPAGAERRAGPGAPAPCRQMAEAQQGGGRLAAIRLAGGSRRTRPARGRRWGGRT